jgi:heavy metal sensor kinase
MPFMNIRSIRFRLAAWYGSLLVLLAVVFGAYCYWRLNDFLTFQLKEVFSHRAKSIANSVLAEIEQSGKDYVRSEIEARYSPAANDRFIRVTDGSGIALYTSGEPNDQSFDPKNVAWPSNALSALSTRIEHVGNHDLLIAAVPIVKGQHRYVIEVGGSTSLIEDVLRKFLVSMLIGLSVTIVAAIWGGVWLIKCALAPVKKITLTAEAITFHHPHKSLPIDKRLPIVKTGDEIESLSKALNQMISRLEESFRSVNRFTADASHELRTPLTIIRGELETSLLDKSLSMNVRETIYSLIEETENLSKIVQSLLSLSRLDAGSAQMEHIRLNFADLVSTTAEQMAPLAEDKHITLATEAEGRVEVEGDRVRLKQVVANLLDNAIKYTPEGGIVKVGVNVSDRRAQLQVSDTGPGISERDLPYVFDRFFRGDRTRLATKIEGAGLGLSIVQSICNAHGGSVEVKNYANGGCRFIVQLPLAT